jgi:hypothetical protein
MWQGIIKFDNKNFDAVRKVCVDISLKDSTFSWTMEQGKLIIKGDDRNKTYKKVVWLINKVEYLKGCPFNIVKL